MKRTLAILAAFLLIAGTAFSQTPVSPVMPKGARSMALGGAIGILDSGYESFFANPAGFAAAAGSLYIAAPSVWAYLQPTEATLASLKELTAEETDDLRRAEIVEQLQSDNNGLGFGFSAGMGWTGKGFGAGINVTTDETTDALILKSRTQLNGIVGIGLPIDLGVVKLNLGVDGRAFYLLESKGSGGGWPLIDFLDGDYSSQAVLGGVGFAVDFGATLEIGPFRAGVAVRDFGLGFNMSEGTLQDVMDLKLPSGGSESYIMEYKVLAALGFKFDLGPLGASLFVEDHDVVAFVNGGIDALWTTLHGGAEITLLKFLYLRGGINEGYVSGGLGVKFPFIEAGASFFTEELGLWAGERPRSGVSASVSLRL